MKNFMEEVANMLGVKLEEEFWFVDNATIESKYYSPYKLTECGLVDSGGDESSATLTSILTGELKIREPLLTDDEKSYLESVLLPYKHRAMSLHLGRNRKSERTHIVISVQNGVIRLPNIEETDTLQFKKLEEGKEYNLDMLKLFRGAK